jgi:ribonuclease BN (tRNA processing enzyme)
VNSVKLIIIRNDKRCVQMKITVIGYWGGFPAANEATSGYLFQHQGFSLLVDCGSAVLSQLQNYIGIEELDAVILSHYHHDHVADIGPMQYARLVKKALGFQISELPIYGHAYDKEAFSKLTYKNITKGIAYNPEQPLTIGPFTISFLQTKHPAVCFAMRITAGGKSVVYTADSSFQDEFIHFSKGADLLISESSFYAGQNAAAAGHMTCSEAAYIAKNANVKHLVLTHLPHFGNHQDLLIGAQAVYDGPITLAKKGLVL